jgi:hypothetical protein
VIENLLGQKILVENKTAFRSGTENISLKSLSTGIYALSVWEEGKLIYRNKIVKH